MQKVKLPLKVDPVRSAQKRLDYDGIIVAGKLERLSEATVGVNSDAEVKLSFDVDAQGLKIVQGTAKVAVDLECQRCGEAFPHNCEIEFTYSPVLHEDQADNLPDAYEPVLVDEHGEIDLLQVIEDELLLSLPQVALHDQADCSVDANNLSFGEIPEEEERPNPFAVLEQLKKH